MERGKKIFLFVVLAVILISGYYLVDYIKSSKAKPITYPNEAYKPAINITLENFEAIVSKNSMIQNLPEGASIKLVFYEGSREEIFILKRASVTKGDAEGTDMEISMPLSYMNGLTDKNFCYILKKAKGDGFFFFSSDLSTTSLLWKYRSMMEYRDCLGF